LQLAVAAAAGGAEGEAHAGDDGGAAEGAALGRFGRGRHGGPLERLALSRHMVVARQASRYRQHSKTTADVVQKWSQKVLAKTRVRPTELLEISCTKKRKVRHRPHASVGKNKVFVANLVLVSREGTDLSKRIPLRQCLDVAFDETTCVKSLSLMHRMSKSTVQRCNMMVACAYLDIQTKLLQRMVAAFGEVPPAFIACRFVWDETGVRLRVPEPGQDPTSSKWEVMVSRVHLTFGWALHAQPMTLEIALPPAIVRSPSAAALYHQMMFGASTGPIHRLVDEMLSLADIAMKLYEADGASGNDKLFAHVLSKDTPNLLHDMKLCHLHQNHLIVTSLVQHLSARLISRLYSMSLILRAFGYFLRMHHACPGVVESMTPGDCFLPGRPDEDALGYNAEVLHYVLCNTQFDENSSSDAPEKIGTVSSSGA
jgi:hypothetical protein